MNKHVENTKNQIDNTLIQLGELGFLRIRKEIDHIDTGQSEILTWKDHVSGRHNAGDAFNTINQYATIYETGAYHAILFDGSIIRAFFEFQKNLLTRQSLLYWPAPIIVQYKDVEENGIREALNYILCDLNCDSKKLRMRTPFRLDFDSSNDSDSHPGSHLHIQHADCRLSSKNPVCFNTFVKFVFSNFYPDFPYLGVVKKFPILHYSGYRINEKAIIGI